MAVYGDYDQAELDRQYNNRARVPEFESIVERWTADGAAVAMREGLLCLGGRNDAGLSDRVFLLRWNWRDAMPRWR